MEDLRAYEPGSSSGFATTSERYSNQMVARKEKRLPTVEETNVVGMKNDVEAVKGKLLEGAMERVVVAIWGMGGLGKTTLAKKVYNDRDIQNHFCYRAWVYVSQEYNIRELLLGIANCVTTLTDEQKRKNENELGEEVYKCLQGKRNLIVLDDIWNTDVWRGLSSYFPAESNKSRVLITTRREDIVVDAHSDCYKLQLLGEKESWELFLNKVGTRAVLTWPGLEEFKKEIVAKCKGLPLTIVVLGGLLSLKDLTRDSWLKVLKSMDWHLSQGPDSCLGILALSYNDLPSYLKPCFLYCGVFPEDSEIKATKLIRLWVAEGFVQKRGKETLEDVAEDYLYELIQRSMIQVADTRDDGRVKSCRIHDLLRDLAISEAKEEKLFEVAENIDVEVLPTSVRRLISSNISQTNSPHLKNSNIRSLILNRSIDEGDEIGRLPPSIGRFVNLQTLDLGYNVIQIPHTIWKLQQMRHLNCYNCRISSRQSMRERSEGLSTSTTILFPGLECLYKLHLVGTIRKLPVETTLYPPNLMQLKLLYTKMEEDPMPILGRLPNLRILTLLQDPYVGTEMNCNHEGFLRLEFLQMQELWSLEDLSVEEGAMPNLKTLKIKCCDKMRKFPDGLLQLKKLQRLNLYEVSQELMSEVLETQGEDWNRIRHIITSQVPPPIRGY
ncbi:putative disease resistance protein [Vitis vinifera]|uniref:Putative disease resistance protein n=1 Tax=Vitis vinifera TaxID=29760 RepID=A0A438G6H2_VITVI|nr:putative disease resistance protein [Vitis vinifera]